MTGNFEIMLSRNILLQLFNARVSKLDNGAAGRADEMVVMLLAAAWLVAGLPVTEMPFLGKAAFGKQLEGAVDRSVTDIGVFLAQSEVEFFGGKVGRAAKKFIQNDLPLPSRFETLLR
jgi:hypothetical protein